MHGHSNIKLVFTTGILCLLNSSASETRNLVHSALWRWCICLREWCLCDILGSHCGVSRASRLLGCDTFAGLVVPSLWKECSAVIFDYWPLKTWNHWLCVECFRLCSIEWLMINELEKMWMEAVVDWSDTVPIFVWETEENQEKSPVNTRVMNRLRLVLPLHQPLRFPNLSVVQSGDDKPTGKIATESEL
jgi:hypothetical protein